MAVRALIQPPPPPPQIIKKSIQVSECWKLWIKHSTILGYVYICNKKKRWCQNKKGSFITLMDDFEPMQFRVFYISSFMK